jgi:hypothetical protein
MEQERLACRRQDRLSLFNFDFDPTRQLHTTPDLSVLGPPPPRHLSSLEDASSGQLAATLLLGARRTLVTLVVAILGYLVDFFPPAPTTTTRFNTATGTSGPRAIQEHQATLTLQHHQT